VTPGPFALYKKKVLLEIGLFDTKNMTQDIEIVWRMHTHGYKARMCLATKVHTSTPSKFSRWWKQRVRWNIGGTQCIIRHKKSLFKDGMLGIFIIPFFTITTFLGLFGLVLFAYLFFTRLISTYLSTYYAYHANTVIFSFSDLSFAPSVLNFFGFTLFIIGLLFTIFVLKLVSDYSLKNKNVFNILFYHIIYLSIYSVLLSYALYKLIRGNYTW